MQQILERIAKALENTNDNTLTAYRSSLQAQDFVEANSLSSVPFYPCYEFRSVGLTCRFSQPTATATVNVLKGYIPVTDGSTLGTFVVQEKETYVFTAPSSGGFTNGGKFQPDVVLFSNIACRALKITLANSCSTGTVDFYLRRFA